MNLNLEVDYQQSEILSRSSVENGRTFTYS